MAHPGRVPQHAALQARYRPNVRCRVTSDLCRLPVPIISSGPSALEQRVEGPGGGDSLTVGWLQILVIGKQVLLDRRAGM